MGDKTSDVVESLAPAAAYAVVAVAYRKSAASVASTAVAVPDVLSVQKKEVSGLPIFCVSSCML